MIPSTRDIYFAASSINESRGIKHCYRYSWQFIFFQSGIINYRDSDRQRGGRDAVARARAHKYGFSRTKDPSIRKSIDQTECTRSVVRHVRARAHTLARSSRRARIAAAVLSFATEEVGKKPFVLSTPRNYPGEFLQITRVSIFSIFFLFFFLYRTCPPQGTRRNSRNESVRVSLSREYVRLRLMRKIDLTRTEALQNDDFNTVAQLVPLIDGDERSVSKRS